MGPASKLAKVSKKALLGPDSYIWFDWFCVPQLPDEDMDSADIDKKDRNAKDKNAKNKNAKDKNAKDKIAKDKIAKDKRTKVDKDDNGDAELDADNKVDDDSDEDSEIALIKKQQQDAISSITQYACVAKHFLVLCPTMSVNTTGERNLKDFASWHSRGWCRAEQTFFFMSRRDASIIVVRSAQCAFFAPARSVLFDQTIGRGLFTVPADREHLRSSLKRLLQAAELQIPGTTGPAQERLRILCALHKKLVEGLSDGGDDDVFLDFPKLISTFSSEVEGDLFADNFGLLQFAAVSDDVSLIQYALYMGGNPDTRLKRGVRGFFFPADVTALSLAANSAGPPAVKALLEARASPHLIDASGLCPLHYAAGRHGEVGLEIVRLLLQAGAKVNQRCGYAKISPLQMAAFSGSLDTARELLQTRADVSLKAATGTGMLGAVAMGSGSVDMARLLLHHRADLEETCLPDCTMSLLSKMANAFRGMCGSTYAVHVLSELPGSSLLHLVAMQGHLPLCEFFCTMGLVSSKHRSCNSKSAVDLALENGFHDIVKVLIKTS
jgi:ankyrin repeat protein